MTDTDTPKPRSKAGQYVWPTATATGVSLVASAAIGGYQMGSRDADLERLIMQQVRAEFVTKETSENRGTILSADIAEMRRAIARIEQATEPIPDMKATLGFLQRQIIEERGR